MTILWTDYPAHQSGDDIADMLWPSVPVHPEAARDHEDTVREDEGVTQCPNL